MPYGEREREACFFAVRCVIAVLSGCHDYGAFVQPSHLGTQSRGEFPKPRLDLRVRVRARRGQGSPASPVPVEREREREA